MPDPDSVLHDGIAFYDGKYNFDGTKLHRLREYEDDFNLPEERYRNASITRRPDSVSSDYLTSFTAGPQEQGDISGVGGIINRLWKVRVDSNTVKVAKTDTSFTGQ